MSIELMILSSKISEKTLMWFLPAKIDYVPVVYKMPLLFASKAFYLFLNSAKCVHDISGSIVSIKYECIIIFKWKA